MKGLPLILFALLGLATVALSIDPPTIHQSQRRNASVVDLVGRRVALRDSPKHAVIYPAVLGPYITVDEAAAHVAGSSHIAAEDVSDGILGVLYPETQRIIEVARGVSPRDPEILLTLRPDAVLVWPEDIGPLETLGIAGIFGLSVDPLDPLASARRLWTLLGAISGREGRSALLLEQWDSERNSLAAALHPSGHPTIVTLYPGSGIGQIGGRYAHLNPAIRLIGARNPADNRVTTTESDLEELLALDPDIILLTTGDPRTPVDLYRTPTWAPLRAVRTRRIYKVPRLADVDGPVDDPLFILWLAELAYGEDSPGRWREMFREVYRRTYHKVLAPSSIDAVLRIEENGASSGYSRFLQARDRRDSSG